MQKKIILTGYGTVARELLKLIHTRTVAIKEKYGVEFMVTGIVGSKGMLYQSEGIDLHALLESGAGSNALFSYSQNFEVPMIEPDFQEDVLIECTPTNVETGEPGLTYLMKAIDTGMDVVCVSKGALVHSYRDIKKRAEEKGIRLKYSGATAAALPTIDIGEYSLSGCTISRIEGILNGTSNFILTCMYENNLSFVEALRIAQEKGIAESNPSLDVKGFDSACKILLLANSLLGTNYSINDIKISGIEHLTREDIHNAKMRNRHIKLLARASKEQGKFILDVTPCELDEEHPLFHVTGTNKGVLFETIEMGTICTTGGASHPRGAAAAALKDLINLYRKDLY
nr:homoserine dehydrogenase [Lysinibacillus timonensis]